jgi:LysR family glycine cleavage system transcriptional activator
MTMSDRRLPPLNALRAFETAARLESFSRAADELAVTPGAVSQQIRQLEEQVGVQLFVREGRAMRLTEAGKAAAGVTTEAFSGLAHAVELMRRPVQRRRLTVSVAPSFAGKWLAPRLAFFQEAHPGIEVWISADRERADLAAGAADLTHHTLLHDSSPETEVDGADWASWFKARGVASVPLDSGVRFNQSALVIDAAVAGRGVALAKRALAQNDLVAGRLVSLFADGAVAVRSAYHIVTARNRPVDADTQAFIAWLKSEASRHVDSVDEL